MKELPDWEKLNIPEHEWKSYSKSKRWRLRYPERQAASSRKWYENNKEIRKSNARKHQLRINYGITEDDYQRMLSDQNGKCAICNTDKWTGKWKVLCIDHCHDTKKVRGLLCNECNRGIGYLKDNIDNLKSAIQYLEKHKD